MTIAFLQFLGMDNRTLCLVEEFRNNPILIKKVIDKINSKNDFYNNLERVLSKLFSLDGIEEKTSSDSRVLLKFDNYYLEVIIGQGSYMNFYY